MYVTDAVSTGECKHTFLMCGNHVTHHDDVEIFNLETILVHQEDD